MKNDEIKNLPESVVEYLHYLQVIKNKSQLTVIEYASDIRLFLRFMMRYRGFVDPGIVFEEIDVSQLKDDFFKSIKLSDAYAFLKYCLDERGNDANARARKTVALRRFFKYLYVNNKIEKNPFENLELPKTKKSLPKYLTLEQSVALLESVDGKYQARDYCILTLFLNCGLRLSELVALNCSDIRSDNTMRVTGKGNKERTIYLNNSCIESINEYLKVRPHEGIKDRDALFISRQMNRISPKTVQHIVKTFLNKSGLADQGYSVHKLRHTAATLMYQHGNVDVLLLKSLLGHENLSTTEIYTHVVDEQLKQAVDSNPLNKVKPK